MAPILPYASLHRFAGSRLGSTCRHCGQFRHDAIHVSAVRRFTLKRQNLVNEPIHGPVWHLGAGIIIVIAMFGLCIVAGLLR